MDRTKYHSMTEEGTAVETFSRSSELFLVLTLPKKSHAWTRLEGLLGHSVVSGVMTHSSRVIKTETFKNDTNFKNILKVIYLVLIIKGHNLKGLLVSMISKKDRGRNKRQVELTAVPKISHENEFENPPFADKGLVTSTFEITFDLQNVELTALKSVLK